MARALPRYVARFISQSGSVRYRFRRTGCPSYYFLSRFGTKAFREEYEACLTGSPPVKTSRRSFRKPKGRFSETYIGRVYFIGEDTGPIKIGFTRKLRTRLFELRVASHLDLRVLASIPGSLADEKAMHKRFAHAHLRGEWFNRTDDLMAEIRSLGGGKVSPRRRSLRHKEA
jgi:hypothetical protein